MQIRSIIGEIEMEDMQFTVEQTTALYGGKLPYANGFSWERVEYFKLEDGVLQPYSGDQILPGPGFLITFKMVP
jgi:hypothetical protein